MASVICVTVLGGSSESLVSSSSEFTITDRHMSTSDCSPVHAIREQINAHNLRRSGEREINPLKKFGDPAGTQTRDLPITSRILLPLSYWTHGRGAKASLL